MLWLRAWLGVQSNRSESQHMPARNEQLTKYVVEDRPKSSFLGMMEIRARRPSSDWVTPTAL